MSNTIHHRTLSNHCGLRYFSLCALYFAQGVPNGFVTIALAALLAERGASPTEVGGMIAVAILPWTFKIFWGPIIDSYRLPAFGQRRPWIVFAQLMMAATLLISVSSTDLTADSTLALIGVIVFIHNCFASLQDVATDALAIDLLDERERGRVNAFMWASKLVGISVGGAGLASVMAVSTVDVALRIMAALLLLIMLLPLMILERPGEKRFPWSRGGTMVSAEAPAATNPMKVGLELWRAFRLRATAMALLLAFVAFIGDGLADATNASVFTTEIGFTAEHYAHMKGIWGVVGQLIGALGGGWLCDRFGAKRMAAAGAIVTSLVFAAFAMSSSLWTQPTFPHGLFFLLLQTGLATTSVSLFTMFMGISWTTAAATQFTLYMTVLNLGNAFGPTLTRLELDATGAYLMCAITSALPLLVLPWIDPLAVTRKRQAQLPALDLLPQPS